MFIPHCFFFFFSSRRRHTRYIGDWSSDVCSSDLFLRVYSPSAEVRGHGPGQETLQVGKREVTIAEVEAVGHYAIRPKFSDGHDTGIYSWDYLYDLGVRQDTLWQQYLGRLAGAGA